MFASGEHPEICLWLEKGKKPEPVNKPFTNNAGWSLTQQMETFSLQEPIVKPLLSFPVLRKNGQDL